MQSVRKEIEEARILILKECFTAFGLIEVINANNYRDKARSLINSLNDSFIANDGTIDLQLKRYTKDFQSELRSIIMEDCN